MGPWIIYISLSVRGILSMKPFLTALLYFLCFLATLVDLVADFLIHCTSDRSSKINHSDVNLLVPFCLTALPYLIMYGKTVDTYSQQKYKKSLFGEKNHLGHCQQSRAATYVECTHYTANLQI